jgi:hypothetical protein
VELQTLLNEEMAKLSTPSPPRDGAAPTQVINHSYIPPLVVLTAMVFITITQIEVIDTPENEDLNRKIELSDVPVFFILSPLLMIASSCGIGGGGVS